MKLIAHGCGPTVYPSNTIASAREALAQGADAVELDVRFTADRCLAVSHDRNLKSAFGADLDCGEITAETFLSLRHRRDPALPSHLLAHFFQCGIAPLLIHLQMKSALGETLDQIEQYGYADRAILGVTEAAAVREAKNRLPGIRVLGFIPAPEEIEAFAAAGTEFIRLWESWLTPENAGRVRESGAGLWVMSGGPGTGCPTGRPGAENLCRILSFEPDAILVNDIPFARAVFAEA